MAAESEVGALDGRLADGSRHEHVHQSVAAVGHGAFQRHEGGLPALGRGAAKLHLDFLVETVDQVQPAFFNGFGRRYDVAVAGYAQHLAVVGGHLGRAVDHRRADVEHGIFGKGFENELITHAVGVAVGDGHS